MKKPYGTIAIVGQGIEQESWDIMFTKHYSDGKRQYCAQEIYKMLPGQKDFSYEE